MPLVESVRAKRVAEAIENKELLILLSAFTLGTKTFKYWDDGSKLVP